MKSATVRDLRNHYSDLMEWIEAGEEIRITRRGKAIARLVPEPGLSGQQIDWSQSPAFSRDRSETPPIPAETARRLIHESAGKW
jgi:prevent-host-death family protein